MLHLRLIVRLLTVVLILCGTSFLHAQESDVLLQTDWQTCEYGKPVTIKSKSTQGVIQGRFPKGWADNSNWTPIVYTSQTAKEGTDRFWRIQIPAATKGHIQLQHDLPTMGGGDFYELTLEARGGLNIGIGIRQKGKPYKFLWKDSQFLTPEWQTYRWRFKVRKTRPNEVGLWLNIYGSPAQIDLKRIKLRQIDLKVLEAANRKRFPGNGPKNLLRQSRLPLGLPSGWSLDKLLDDQTQVKITSVPDQSSPTGSAVLRIVSPNTPMKLFGEPLQIDRNWLPHTASVYVKGEGKFDLSVNNARKRLGHSKIKLTPAMGWKRLVVAFKPIVSDDVTYLLFEGQGTFAIDGLMVHSGKGAQPYESQLPAEVALAPGRGEIASYTRTHFEDEKPSVRYVVTGVSAGSHARLRVKVINIYGMEKELPAIKLNSKRSYQGRVDYNVFADQPYGSFRIEAWVEDDKDKNISTFNELVMHRLRRPRYWLTDAPDSPFGVHTLSTRRHIQMAKAVGINWTRLHDAGTDYTGWYHLEPTPGKWEFRDAELKRYRKFGMKILGLLSTAPKWASMYPGFDVSGYFDRYYIPKDFNQFANEYVKVVVKRYKGVIDAWDVWNEPWGTWWASGYDRSKKGRLGYIQGPNETKSFAEFMKVVYQAVKEVTPNATVAGFNTYATGGGVKWTRGIIQNGGTPYGDVFGYHHYTQSNSGYPGDVVQESLQQQMNLFPGKKLPYPAWMTEGSPTSGLIDAGFYHYTLPKQSDENVIQTADRLGRYSLSMLVAGVEKFFLYSMHCHQYFGLGNEHHVLMTPEGYLHPSADALSALAYFLEDKTYRSHKELVKGVHAYRFKNQSQQVTVLSTAPGPHDVYVLPANPGVSYFDLFGNPVSAGSKLGDTLVFVVKSSQ